VPTPPEIKPDKRRHCDEIYRHNRKQQHVVRAFSNEPVFMYDHSGDHDNDWGYRSDDIGRHHSPLYDLAEQDGEAANAAIEAKLTTKPIDQSPLRDVRARWR
jgi:hypothetical protein